MGLPLIRIESSFLEKGKTQVSYTVVLKLNRDVKLLNAKSSGTVDATTLSEYLYLKK